MKVSARSLFLLVALVSCRKAPAPEIEPIAALEVVHVDAEPEATQLGFDDQVLRFGMALADNDGSGVLASLADDVSVTWAGAATPLCVGPLNCWNAWQELRRATGNAELEPVLWLLAAPRTRIMQGVWHGRRDETPLGVGVAAVIEGNAQDKVAEIRVYASRQAWQSQTQPALGLPLVPTAVALWPYEAVHGAPLMNAETLAHALSPVVLAQDATAAGLVDSGSIWHDAETGRVLEGAETHRLSLPLAVTFVRTLNVWAVGGWIAVERVVAEQRQRATSPAPVQALELARTVEGRVVEVWRYADGAMSSIRPPKE